MSFCHQAVLPPPRPGRRVARDYLCFVMRPRLLAGTTPKFGTDRPAENDTFQHHSFTPQFQDCASVCWCTESCTAISSLQEISLTLRLSITHTDVSPISCLVPGELTSAQEQAGRHTRTVYILRQATTVVNNSTAVLKTSFFEADSDISLFGLTGKIFPFLGRAHFPNYFRVTFLLL